MENEINPELERIKLGNEIYVLGNDGVYTTDLMLIEKGEKSFYVFDPENYPFEMKFYQHVYFNLVKQKDYERGYISKSMNVLGFYVSLDGHFTNASPSLRNVHSVLTCEGETQKVTFTFFFKISSKYELITRATSQEYYEEVISNFKLFL